MVRPGPVVLLAGLAANVGLGAGADERTIRIWNPAIGIELTILRADDDKVNAVCSFSLGGRTVVCMSHLG